MYLFGLLPVNLNCFSGGSAPAVAPPTPPPQPAKTPDATTIRKAAADSAAGTGDIAPGAVTLLGDPTALDDKLGKKTLLGK